MPEQQQATADWQPASFETPAPNIARVYDYLLGGKDNYAPIVSSPSGSSRRCPRCTWA